mmetsp:Transcript_50386/g.57806  ORF Transcript_50386/g.57806 Transcript_50386/m.57806 type:complete len:89 (+) Transcript_50386:665-931(+)
MVSGGYSLSSATITKKEIKCRCTHSEVTLNENYSSHVQGRRFFWHGLGDSHDSHINNEFRFSSHGQIHSKFVANRIFGTRYHSESYRI